MEQNQELTFYYINKKKRGAYAPLHFLYCSYIQFYTISFGKFAERQRSKIFPLVRGTTTAAI